MAKVKKEVEEVKNGPQDILSKHLKENEGDHYNGIEEVKDYKISSGSLILDSQLGGGFSAGGLNRFVGFTEGGKTSESLEVIRNFIITVPKSRALLVKAEGRLSQEMQERSGLTFVWSAEEWIQGTVFVLETNNYNLVVNIMRDLVQNNADNFRYIFVLDSMDALILKSDMDKDIEEAGKVAGSPMLTKKFMQRLAIAMNKLGHMCIMIGQVSAKVEIDPYAPKDQRQISATGGNAAMHFANWILQFEPRFKGDLIMEDEKAAPDPVKNKILGHWCKIIIKKSPNEKSNMIIKYPIKYGRIGGKSIWREYEITDLLIAFEKVAKKGAWLSVDEEFVKEAKGAGFDFKVQHQGIDNFRTYLEENEKLTDWLFEKLKGIISS
jgi:hypothetical protein